MNPITEPLGLSQPTASHHMKLLVDSGLVSREQPGKWAYCRVNDDVLNGLAGALSTQRLYHLRSPISGARFHPTSRLCRAVSMIVRETSPTFR